MLPNKTLKSTARWMPFRVPFKLIWANYMFVSGKKRQVNYRTGLFSVSYSEAVLFTETPVWHTFGAINISMCHSKKNFNNSRSSKERKKWLLLQMAQSLFQGVHRSTSAVECSTTTGFVLAFYAPVSVMLASWKKAATRPEIFTHTHTNAETYFIVTPHL